MKKIVLCLTALLFAASALLQMAGQRVSRLIKQFLSPEKEQSLKTFLSRKMVRSCSKPRMLLTPTRTGNGSKAICSQHLMLLK